MCFHLSPRLPDASPRPRLSCRHDSPSLSHINSVVLTLVFATCYSETRADRLAVSFPSHSAGEGPHLYKHCFVFSALNSGSLGVKTRGGRRGVAI